MDWKKTLVSMFLLSIIMTSCNFGYTKEDCITEGCGDGFICCASCFPAMCIKENVSSNYKQIKNITETSIFDRIDISINVTTKNPFVESVKTFEEIPNGSRYCVPDYNSVTDCHWVRGMDDAWREACYTHLVHIENCSIKN